MLAVSRAFLYRAIPFKVTTKMKTRYSTIAYLLLLVSSLLPVSAKEIPSAKPADVGMSAEKLANVDNAMNKLVEEKMLAGGTVAIARNGKMVHFKSYGQMDLEAKKPMQNDTIVRIYSMSKAITSAAALTLFDDGKLELNAPVSKYLPELKKSFRIMSRIMSECGIRCLLKQSDFVS